jgi:hypothetical protein
MTSKIKVNILADGGDNSIITSDGAGSFTASSSLASSVQSVGGIQMTPAFEAKQSSSQSLTSDTYTKINFDTERFDTDSTYASSRFTPAVAGKYFIYSSVCLTPGNQTDWAYGNIAIYKNGVEYGNNLFDSRGSLVFRAFLSIARTIDFNTTDYVEIYARLTADDGAGVSIQDTNGNCFGGYRIIGA